MRCRISTALLARLVAEARSVPDQQVCGVLLGHAWSVEGRIDIPNVAKDPFRGSMFDPGAYLAASRTARLDGYNIVGIYHSHKSHSVAPSRQDVKQVGEPGRYVLIIATGGETGLWVSRPGGEVLDAFDPVELYVD